MDAGIAALSVAAFSAAMLAPAALSAWAAVALALLLAGAVARRSAPAAHVALLGLAWAGVAWLFPASRTWPVKILAPLGIYLIVVALTLALKRSRDWLTRGRVVWGDIAAVAVVSAAALAAWAALTNPDLSVHLSKIPDIPLWMYPLAAFVFAAGNAAVEEFVFRGVVMGSLDRTLGANVWAIALQAVSFGAAHFVQGFPNGWVGFAMTGVYGAMLGVVRRRSGGLLAPWIAHVGADLTIFALLVSRHGS